MQTKTESAEVLYADDRIVTIDAADIADLTGAAAVNPRRRIRVCGALTDVAMSWARKSARGRLPTRKTGALSEAGMIGTRAVLIWRASCPEMGLQRSLSPHRKPHAATPVASIRRANFAIL